MHFSLLRGNRSKATPQIHPKKMCKPFVVSVYRTSSSASSRPTKDEGRRTSEADSDVELEESQNAAQEQRNAVPLAGVFWRLQLAVFSHFQRARRCFGRCLCRRFSAKRRCLRRIFLSQRRQSSSRTIRNFVANSVAA